MNRLITLLTYALPGLLLLLLPWSVSAQGGSIFSIQSILWTFVNNVFGFLLGAAGVMLDWSLQNFVVDFGQTFVTGGVGNAVDTGWAIIRDIFNLTFIFGLVWLGLKMILNSDDAGTRRWLVYLILAALLVNFSLFFTKFIVDFSNILATQILTSGFTSVTGAAGGTDPEVSEAFMQMFGVSSIFESGAVVQNPIASGAQGGYMYIFGAAIVFLIGAFCFFAGAIMIIIRFVALCIYMVFSPLMFIGWVFPQMAGVTSKYWSGFLGRAFFAPAYVVLIYLAAYVMAAYRSTGGSMAEAFLVNGGATGPSTTAEVLVNFTMVSVFLIAAVVVGNKLSADGAAVSIRAGKNIAGRGRRFARNTAVGTGRFAARNTAGWATQQTVNRSAEAMQRRYNRLDARLSQTKSGRALRGAASVATLGALRDKNVQSALGAGKRMSIAGSETLAQKRERERNLQKRQNATNTEREREEQFIGAVTSFNENKAIYENSDDAQKRGMAKKEMDVKEKEIAALVSRMTVAEITRTEGLGGIADEDLKSKVVAKNLSDAQIKGLEDSGQYNNQDIKAIKDARTDGIFSDVTEGFQDVSASVDELEASLDNANRTISRWSTDTLEGMAGSRMDNGKTRLADERIATNLTQRQLDSMRDSGKITSGDYQDVMEARNSGFAKIATNGSLVDSSTVTNAGDQGFIERRRAKLFSQNAQDAGKLPAAVYATKEMAPHITPAALTQRVRNGLSADEVKAIEKNINDNTGPKEAEMWKKWSQNTTEGGRFNF